MRMDNHGLKLTTTGRRQVEEVSYGMYVWRTPDGEVLGDGEGNIMNVFCTKGDQKAIRAITEAARSYGFEEGQAEWWTGKRPISDEEYEEQLARQAMGLVADPLDIGAIRDEMRSRKIHG